MHAAGHFPAARELRDEVVAHVREVDQHLLEGQRCRLEEHIDDSGRRRHLLTDFRRRPGDATKRVLL